MSRRFRKSLPLINYLISTALVLSTVVLVLDLPKLHPPAKAAGEKMVLLWDTGLGGSVPTGWTNASATYGNYFLRGDTVANVGLSLSPTHTHTAGTVAFSDVSTPTVDTKANKTNVPLANAPHGHSIVGFSMVAATILPVYRDMIAITYDAGIPTTLPQYAIAMFDSAEASVGFSDYSSQNSYMLRIAATSGGTGGATTHTHASFSVTSDVSNANTSVTAGTGATAAADTHTHTYGPTTSPASTDHTPLHTEVDLRYVTNSGGTAIPVGMIAMFNGDPNIDSSNWDVISDGGEAFGGVFIEAQATYATGKGNATHYHPLNVTSSTWTAATIVEGPPPATTQIGTHSHTISGNFSTENNTPPYINVVVAKKQAAYTPQMNNWQWFADEGDETPGTAYAAETTGATPNEPPQVEMGLRIPLKLRINITETAGTGENNSRKRLQWSTDQSTWTNVAEWGAVGDQYFRYTTDLSGGDDNVLVTTNLLTGTTQSGIHNESNSDSPSNSDHTASATLELEYAFEIGNSATTSTAYYFQLYDQVLDAAIPLGSGKCRPKLTTATAFDLSLSGPSEVYFGSFQLGDPLPHTYQFTDGEKFTMRDNRGVMDDGWTTSADITDLTAGGYTILDDDIRWISYTTDIVALYDAPVTGMSGNPGEYMTGSVTVVDVTASGRNGHGGFTMRPYIQIYTVPFYASDYSGTLTLTII